MLQISFIKSNNNTLSLSEHSKQLLDYCFLNFYPKDLYLQPLSTPIWTISDNNPSSISSSPQNNDNFTASTVLSDDDNHTLLHISFSWTNQQSNSIQSEQWYPSPIKELEILAALDTSSPQHSQQTLQAQQTFQELQFLNTLLDNNSPNYNSTPFSPEDFISLFSIPLSKCEATVKYYLSKNNTTTTNIFSLSAVVRVFLSDEDELLAEKYDGSFLPFNYLTIGQFISITDELLYRLQQDS